MGSKGYYPTSVDQIQYFSNKAFFLFFILNGARQAYVITKQKYTEPTDLKRNTQIGVKLQSTPTFYLGT